MKKEKLKLEIGENIPSLLLGRLGLKKGLLPFIIKIRGYQILTWLKQKRNKGDKCAMAIQQEGHRLPNARHSGGTSPPSPKP